MKIIVKYKKAIGRMLPEFLRYRLTKHRFARKYIKKKYSVTEFFEVLNAREVNYAVLRWFDELPNIRKDEDIDILIDQEDIHKLDDLISNNTAGIKCDIYATDGQPGFSFKNLPYYPINLAKNIVENTELFKDKFKVPNAQYHFLSLAYHALYHKGYSSGLLCKNNPEKSIDDPENNYLEVLTELANQLDLKFEDFSLEELAIYLKKQDWQPPYDTLEKLSKHNRWIKDYFFKNTVRKIDPYLEGVTVFVIRENGEDFIDEAEKIITFEGFEILGRYNLQKRNNLSHFTNRIRGGNWGKGPFPKSGGKPIFLFVCIDVFPLTVPESISDEHVGLSNLRTYNTKIKVRNTFNKGIDKKKRCNIIHSSDNAFQALDYIHPLSENENNEIKLKAKEHFDFVKFDYEVISQLPSRTRRAAVYKINYNDELHVLKVFRKSKIQYLTREIEARKVFENCIHEISPITKQNTNYIITPFYKKFKDPLFFELTTFIKMRQIISEIQKKGYEYIDFSPENIIRTSKKEFVIIDFEFLQKFKRARTASVKDNFSWNLPDAKFGLDIPNNYKDPFRFWKMRFLIPKSIAHKKSKSLLSISRFISLFDLVNWFYIIVFYFKRKK